MKDITFKRIRYGISLFLFLNIVFFTCIFLWSFFLGMVVSEDFSLRDIWPFTTETISYIYGTLWKLIIFQVNWLDANLLMVSLAVVHYIALIISVLSGLFYEETMDE